MQLYAYGQDRGDLPQSLIDGATHSDHIHPHNRRRREADSGSSVHAHDGGGGVLVTHGHSGNIAQPYNFVTTHALNPLSVGNTGNG